MGGQAFPPLDTGEPGQAVAAGHCGPQIVTARFEQHARKSLKRKSYIAFLKLMPRGETRRPKNLAAFLLKSGAAVTKQ